ncbi:hypothetical protein BC941DRAFT_409614 [Chlamydoabsidia padenii]|nr:hypothetical protein BC941DRAFT_409614 [Chlamydoabsidia padenii]
MGHHEPLTLSFKDDLDHNFNFADELLSQFDLKRESLHEASNKASLDDNDKEQDGDINNTIISNSNTSNTQISNHSSSSNNEPDTNTTTPLNSSNRLDTLTTAPVQPVISSHLPSTIRSTRKQNNLLRRSSTYLRKHFFAAEDKPPPPLPDVKSPPPSFSPTHYPPKPLCYSPVVNPPNDTHRSSLPIPWRKKSAAPRRQSEPLIPVKPKRSIFPFL